MIYSQVKQPPKITMVYTFVLEALSHTKDLKQSSKMCFLYYQ